MADHTERDRGFALVEYIIAIAISSLLIVVLAAAVGIVIRNQNLSANKNDESNGSLGLTNYFPVDVASTPPSAREVDSSLTTGCSGDSPGYNLLRLTWTAGEGSTSVNRRVSYRLVGTPNGGEVRRYACSDESGTYGSPTTTRVAFGLRPVPAGWVGGDVPAVVTLTDHSATLTLTSMAGNSYGVQGSSFNPGVPLDTIAPSSTSLSLRTAMTLDVSGYATVGDVLTYSITIANENSVEVTDLTATPSNAGATSECATTLAPGSSTTCTATHTVTQSDLDDGSITATVDVTGTHGSQSVSSTAVNTVAAAGAPAVALSLTSSSPTYSTSGQSLQYTLGVANTGNVTLTSLTTNFSDASVVSACTPLPLAPGATATCTASHTVTAAQYGSTVAQTVNVLASTANNGGTGTITSQPLNITFSAGPKLSISASKFTGSPYASGGKLTFNLSLYNIGNVDLTGLAVGYSRTPTSSSCPTSLARGATVLCTASFTTTAADYTAKSVAITATASGTGNGQTVSVASTARAVTSGIPAISVLMNSTSARYAAVGDVLQFSLQVTNVGSVSLTSITPTFSGATASAACSPSSLTPGSTATCTATHTVTAAEYGSAISAGASAYATGAGAAGNSSTVTATAATVDFVAAPGLTITQATSNPDHLTIIGESVTISLSVRNSGNVALTNVSVGFPADMSAGSCPITLAIGATATCTATRTTTSDDAIAGFTAIITASGTYGSTTRTTSTDLFIASAVPCAIVSGSGEPAGAPGSVTLVGAGPRGTLTLDVVITIRTAGRCSGLRLQYFPHAPGSVIVPLTSTVANHWTYTIPGDAAGGSPDWGPGAQTISVLPATSTGSTPLFTDSSAFRVR